MPSSPLPTLLAFHGSGSNSTIHMVQLGRLNRLLQAHFNIIPLEAPFPSAAGPGVLPFFEGCGPFKRWVSPQETAATSARVGDKNESGGFNLGTMSAETERVVRAGIDAAEAEGSRVVGCIGFSQGTRVVAGLLKARQIYVELVRKGVLAGNEKHEWEWLDCFRFGLSVCGSYPPALVPAGLHAFLGHLKEKSDGEVVDVFGLEHKRIDAPTLHIQGRLDEWEWAGRILIENVYDRGDGKSLVLDLNIGHHYPVEMEDNETVGGWMVETYRRVWGASEEVQL